MQAEVKTQSDTLEENVSDTIVSLDQYCVAERS